LSDLLDEIDSVDTLSKRYLGLSWQKLGLLAFIVIISGIYIGIILFGENSLQVLLNLEEYEVFLQDEVTQLKVENASLQKELFELKELDPDN
jgi:hypothetical protein